MLEILAAGVKAVLYAAALSAAGAALARATITSTERPDGEVEAARVEAWSGAALVAAAVVSAVIYVVRLGNYWDVPTLVAIFLSPLGASIGLLVVGGVGLAAKPGRLSAAVAAFVIVVAFAISGHAAAMALVPAVLVAAHIGAAAWWIGGLWLLLFAGAALPQERFAVLVERFSAQALWLVAALVAAGAAVAAWLLRFSVDLSRGYDRGLLLKIGIALVLLSLAAINKFVITPALLHSSAARLNLRRAIVAELGLVAAILVATASLTTFSSPHQAPPATEIVVVNGPIDIVDPWVAPTPGGVDTAAGYLSIVNNRLENEKLVSARSPRARSVSLHEMRMDEDIMRMRDVDALDIPAEGRLDLASGKYHLMFNGLDAPFAEGDSIPLTLVFERTGEITFNMPVTRLRAVHGH